MPGPRWAALGRERSPAVLTPAPGSCHRETAGGWGGETDTQLFSRRGDEQYGNPEGKVLETLPFSGGTVTQSWMPVTFTHRAHHGHCPPMPRAHRRGSPGKGSRQPRGPRCQCRHTRPWVSGMLTTPRGLLSKPRSPRVVCPRSARPSVPAPRLSITQREQAGPASRAEGTEQKEDGGRGQGGWGSAVPGIQSQYVRGGRVELGPPGKAFLSGCHASPGLSAKRSQPWGRR